MIDLGNNEQGKPLFSKIVNKGEKYGLNDCLMHDENEPLIGFYGSSDLSYPISFYYRATLMGQHDENLAFLNKRPAALHGVCLCGSSGLTATAEQVRKACNAQGHELRYLKFKEIQGAEND